MTLIAAWLDEDRPFIAGDFLLTTSGDFDGNPHATIATTRDTERALPREYGVRVSGTRQKICIVSKNLAIAWAGSVIVAEAVVRDLYEKFAGKVCTLLTLSEMLRSQEPTRTEVSCTIIGWVVEQEVPVLFEWHSQHPNVVSTPEAPIAEGSAKDRLPEIVNSDYRAGLSDPVHRAISGIGHVLGQEVISGYGLLGLSGGGMQLAHYHEGKFSFVGSILSLFLLGFESEKGVSLLPMSKILKSSYEEGWMRLDVPQTTNAAEGESHWMSSLVPGVANPSKDATPYQGESDYYLLYTETRRLSGDTLHAVLVFDHASHDKYLKFENVEGGTAILLSSSILQTLSQQIAQAPRPPEGSVMPLIRPSREGTITTWLRGKHEDWFSNSHEYGFNPIVGHGIHFEAYKNGDGTITIFLVGLPDGPVVFRNPVPPCGKKGLFVGISWSPIEAKLYLNGELVETRPFN